MQQQHLMQMQPMMAAYASSNQVTTDVIQQYLDENKQLILAILENQNSGKAEECAENQAKLQRNLMYLAAIADSQPQMPTVAQYPTNTAMQSSGLYMNQQQHQQMTPQSLMAARTSMLYAQSPMSALTQQQQQHQQSMHGHLSMSSIPTGNTSTGGGGFPILHGEASLRGNGGGGFPDFARGKQESGGGSHSSYLKASEEEGNNNNNNNNNN